MVSLHYFSNIVGFVAGKSDHRALFCAMCSYGGTKAENFAMKILHEPKQKRNRNNEKLVKWRNFNTKSNETANRACANEKTSCTLWTMLRASSDLAADAFDPNTCRLYSDLLAFIATPLGNGVDSFYAQLLFVCLLSISIAFVAMRCVMLFVSLLNELLEFDIYAQIAYTQCFSRSTIIKTTSATVNILLISIFMFAFYSLPRCHTTVCIVSRGGRGCLLLKVEFNRKLWLKMLLVSAQTHTHV